MDSSTPRPDRSPAIAELLDDAFVAPVGVDVAARHLWVIHTEAQRLAREAEGAEEVDEASTTAPRASLAGSRRIPRAAVPVLALMMVLSTSGVAVAASQGSLPGDVLYPVKRGTEQAQLIFMRDPVSRAELQLSFARTRLEEIQRIADTRPHHVPSLVADIASTLGQVEHSPPEVAARVQPASDSLRRETTQSIASLSLPRDVGEAVTVAMTVTPVGTPTTGTATPAPTPGGLASTGATAAETPSDEQVVATGLATEASTAAVVQGASASPSSSAASTSVTTSASPTPSPSATSSPGPSASPSASPTSSASSAPSGSSAASPSTGGSGSPTAGGSAAPPAGGTATPVVTPRPQPAEGDGESRSDEEDQAQSPAGDDATLPPASSGDGHAGQTDAAAPESDGGQSTPAPEATGGSSGPVVRR